MAEFTSRLNQPSGSSPVINTGKAVVDPLKPVAGLANAAVSIFDKDARLKRQKRIDEEKRRADEALDKLAITAFNFQTTPQGKKIEQAKKAENAGAVSRTQSRATIDSEVRSLLVEYPDQAYEIYTQLDELGLDTPLFREFRFNEAQKDAAEQGILDARKTSREAVVNAGMNIEAMTEEEVYAEGREILRTEFEFNRLVAQNKEDRAAAAELRSQRTEARNERAEQRSIRAEQRAEESHQLTILDKRIKRNTDNALLTLQQRVGTQIPYAIRDLTALTNKAASSLDADDIAALDQSTSQLLQDLTLMRAQGLQSLSQMEGIGPEAFEKWNAYIDSYVTLLEDMTSGDMSARKIMTNQLNDLTSFAEFEAYELAPTLMRAKAIFGGGGLATMLTDAMIRNPETADTLATEASNLFDALEVNSALPNIDAINPAIQPEILQAYKQGTQAIRDAAAGDLTPEHYRAYSTMQRTRLSTVKPGETLVDVDAGALVQDALSARDLALIGRMRAEDPSTAAALEGDLARVMDQAFNSMTTRNGQFIIDVAGDTEGQPMRVPFVAGDPLGGGPPPLSVPEASNVKWDVETKSFVAFGGNRLMLQKAENLNRVLAYLVDYSSHYRGDSEDTIINLYVHNKLDLPEDPLDKALKGDMSQ